MDFKGVPAREQVLGTTEASALGESVMRLGSEAPKRLDA